MYHSATVVMSSAKLVSFPLKLVVFEADVHDPISNLIRIPIFQWFVVKCGFKNGHPKCMCSTFVKHHGLNNWHNWGDQLDCFMALMLLSIAKPVSFPLKLVIFKANVHDPITYLIRIPIFQWFVIKCGSKNGHPKCMCSTFVEHHGLHSPHNWGGGGGPTWLFYGSDVFDFEKSCQQHGRSNITFIYHRCCLVQWSRVCTKNCSWKARPEYSLCLDFILNTDLIISCKDPTKLWPLPQARESCPTTLPTCYSVIRV